MPLNSTSASLLGLLHEGERTGGELVRVATDLFGEFWSVPRSQVYRELTTLAADGLITERATGPRGRRPFAITASGKAAFRRWLDTEPGPAYARNRGRTSLLHVSRGQGGDRLPLALPRPWHPAAGLPRLQS